VGHEQVTTTHQSESKRTTTSAVTRLMPRPPARVVRRKANFSESGALYSSMAEMRSSCAVFPSIRQYSARGEGRLSGWSVWERTLARQGDALWSRNIM
jgi:hypothetical protein